MLPVPPRCQVGHGGQPPASIVGLGRPSGVWSSVAPLPSRIWYGSIGTYVCMSLIVIVDTTTPPLPTPPSPLLHMPCTKKRRMCSKMGKRCPCVRNSVTCSAIVLNEAGPYKGLMEMINLHSVSGRNGATECDHTCTSPATLVRTRVMADCYCHHGQQPQLHLPARQCNCTLYTRLLAEIPGTRQATATAALSAERACGRA